jgi:hypothetical protein
MRQILRSRVRCENGEYILKVPRQKNGSYTRNGEWEEHVLDHEMVDWWHDALRHSEQSAAHDMVFPKWNLTRVNQILRRLVDLSPASFDVDFRTSSHSLRYGSAATTFIECDGTYEERVAAVQRRTAHKSQEVAAMYAMMEEERAALQAAKRPNVKRELLAHFVVNKTPGDKPPTRAAVAQRPRGGKPKMSRWDAARHNARLGASWTLKAEQVLERLKEAKRLRSRRARGRRKAAKKENRRQAPKGVTLRTRAGRGRTVSFVKRRK